MPEFLAENPQTLMVMLVAVQMLLYAAGWIAVMLAMRAERWALSLWGLGWTILGVGLALLALRGDTRTWWAFTGSNIFFITGFSLVRLGLERFIGVNHLRETVATLALASVILVVLGPGGEHAPWRVVIVYGVGAWLMFRVLFILKPVADEFGTGWAALVACPVLMLGVSSASWATLQLLDMSRSIELHRFSVQNARVLFSYLVVAGVFNLTFVVLVMLRLVQRLRTQNERDALTGLYNRRAMESALAREWHRFERSRQVFSVLMIDIDHFKRVNDTFGHGVGDVVLQQVAERIRVGARALDMPTRYGGEEFLVLMPLCDAPGAAVVAERIRAGVEARPFNCELPASAATGAGVIEIKVTVSVGVATADIRDRLGVNLVSRADAALYAAKHAGRNRVEIAAPPVGLPIPAL